MVNIWVNIWLIYMVHIYGEYMVNIWVSIWVNMVNIWANIWLIYGLIYG